MLRSAASKVMWVGRATVFLIGVAVIVGLTVGLTSTVFAQAQPGQGQPGVFRLAATNTANAVSSLVNTGSGPALDLQVQQGQAPMTVNSGAKVANLNADTVDGKSDTDFYATGSKVADSAHADNATNADSATNAQNAQKASNADTLDGKDSTAFAGSGETAYSNGKLVPTCAREELVSIPFSVDRPSLVYANASAVFTKTGTTANSADMTVKLLDATSGVTLAAGGATGVNLGSTGGITSPMAVQGVLRSGSSAYEPSAAPFVATPGKEYRVQASVNPFGPCGSSAVLTTFTNAQLSYLLIGKE